MKRLPIRTKRCARGLITCFAGAAVTLLLSAPAEAASKKADSAKAAAPKEKMSSGTFTGLTLRNLGPAFNSGRVIDVASPPGQPGVWYVAAASGGVWKTTNRGTTWTPIFDDQGSYSIGCVALDPKDPLVVWVGSGENNSQRSVGYGDGVYKSLDGGKSWENVGLKLSEHIGKILIDPRDSNVVYVAAQGPLWSAGGDRGLYKTTDGGATWKKVLEISENTGVSDIAFDPRNPDVVYATAYQRRRHVWTLVNGGPESALYKSRDGGATWKKLTSGLPTETMGRIGIAVAPSRPDTVYAVVEAAAKAGGFFRSTDAGGSWEKRSDYVSGSPQYYQEILVDPLDADRVYSMDTWMNVTEDGGKTFKRVGEKFKHVDNHALWIDPADTNHLISGCDGGLYETYDRGATWAFTANLPITQFYRIALDNDRPFYNVYGGTQDNWTLGGPSRTKTVHGITNYDWYVTVGGDGFEPAIDPQDPNIVYSQAQHGALVRFDRKSGERVDIQPQPDEGDAASRWNWDSPILISPHSHTRLYFGSQRLYRSDDRGDTWHAVSPDLTRQIDRNRLPVMGKIQSIDAVAKNASTSFYGNLVSLTESPVVENLIYVGSDDGAVQITESAGGEWRKVESFPGVPDRSYVSDLEASAHDGSTVFAAFDNHKMGDFKPYLLKSTDRGRSWTSIAGDLPARGTVYTVAEDPGQRDLLFAGTEFGLFFTVDGGKKWIQLKGGMPIIAVRDLAIQARENDLAVASFGRGFYLLDDYTPLRRVSESFLKQDSILFSVKTAPMFIPTDPLGGREKSFLGEAFYTAPNPPFGAVFTYYLAEEIKTQKKQRQEKEKKQDDEKVEIPYPAWENLRREDREEAPAILLTVRDEAGNVVRRVTGPVTAGFHRVAWDLHFPASNPTAPTPAEVDPWAQPPTGPLAMPGTYRVELAKRVDGVTTPLGEPQTFQAVAIGTSSLGESDRRALLAFQQKTARLQRAVLGALESVGETQSTIDLLKKTVDETPGALAKTADDVRALDRRLKDILIVLAGDETRSRRNEATLPSLADRVAQIVEGHWLATTAPTATHRRNYEIAAKAFGATLSDLRTLVEVDLKALEDELESRGAPWTPGRVPRWSAE